MASDAKKISVTENPCNVCGTERIVAFHEGFPELRVASSSGEQAVQQLSGQLLSSLDFVTDPAHREPIRLAIADAQAFLDEYGAAHLPQDV